MSNLDELREKLKASYYRASGGMNNIAEVEAENTMKLFSHHLQEETLRARKEELEAIYVATDGSMWHKSGYKLGDKTSKQYNTIRIEDRIAQLTTNKSKE